MLNGVESEYIADKNKIMAILQRIINNLVFALQNERPFIFSGITFNGAAPEPFGLNYGTDDQVEDMLPIFLENNKMLLKALNYQQSVAPEPKKHVKADILKQPDGGVIINFLK